MYSLNVPTQRHDQFIVLDERIQELVTQSGIRDGVCMVYCPHTTAGLTINENADPDVRRDMTMILDRVVPWQGGYAHAEGNSAAHVKASMMGASAQVFIRDGALQFGTWQSIYFCEFDGPRERTVWVQIVEAR